MAWQNSDRVNWLKEQKVLRSYRNDVLEKIDELRSHFDVIEYGSLSIDKSKYPLFVVKSKKFNSNAKTLLITGGVHGYETSGVHGALKFMESYAHHYAKDFNVVCAPCLSPWAYETINRWNPFAIDPNRSFFQNSPAEECQLFLNSMKDIDVFAHFDLHETTDTDNTVFRPALEARDGVTHEFSEIPDGFYLVGDTSRPQPAFQKAIINSVKKITHIAPPDNRGKLIGVDLEQEGVINYDTKKLFLCAGFSDAPFVTTTEVYPDSPRTSPQECIDAQVAAVCGGIDFLLSEAKY